MILAHEMPITTCQSKILPGDKLQEKTPVLKEMPICGRGGEGHGKGKGNR